MSDVLDLVDDDDRPVGRARRADCHGNPALIHRAVHVHLFNRHGELLLQKRSPNKDVQPDRWDTSVGGHLDAGEGYLQAARREMAEELGLNGVPLTFLYTSKIRNEFESENVATYLAQHDGPFRIERREIAAIRFWSAAEIEAAIGSGRLTPNFEEEWALLKRWQRCFPPADGAPVALCAGDAMPDLLRRLDD